MNYLKHLRIVIISFILLTLYYLYSYKKDFEYFLEFSIKAMEYKKEIKKEMPPILVWNSKCITTTLEHSIDREFPGYPELPYKFKCPYNCTFTRDRKFEVNASTIIFPLHEFCPMDGWPQNRREDQNYMMHTMESTSNTIHFYDRKLMTNTFFNSSITYRLDASIFMPNDALVRITSETPKEDIWDQKEVLEKAKNKTKFAFQAVSHCNALSHRDHITKKLGEMVQVNVVGGCSGIKCDGYCYLREIGQYFFYLAFENSVCHHYITEKFWNSLRALTVPIVLTRSVFKGLDIPPNAFIALDDFLSINELVEHLKALKNNTEEYLKHFEWTKTYTKKHFGFNYSPICKICEYATKHFEQKTKNIINLNEFWNEEHCNNNFVKKFLKI